MRHRLEFSEDDLRVILYALDLYVNSWRTYAKRRQRDSDLMRGIRINSADEKSLQENVRVDIIAAEDKIIFAGRLREKISKHILPTKLG